MKTKEEKLIDKLGKALAAAVEHLEYCNFGDNWERAGAEAQNLPKKLDKALCAFTSYKKDRKIV